MDIQIRYTEMQDQGANCILSYSSKLDDYFHRIASSHFRAWSHMGLIYRLAPSMIRSQMLAWFQPAALSTEEGTRRSGGGVCLHSEVLLVTLLESHGFCSPFYFFLLPLCVLPTRNWSLILPLLTPFPGFRETGILPVSFTPECYLFIESWINLWAPHLLSIPL